MIRKDIFQNLVVSVINQENGPGKSAADGRERIDYYCEELNNLLNELINEDATYSPILTRFCLWFGRILFTENKS